jgi:hypothetical protein
VTTNAKGERGCPEEDRAGRHQRLISEIKCLRDRELLKGIVERLSEALVDEGKAVCATVQKDIELLGVTGRFQ